jgi:hypothetical protein
VGGVLESSETVIDDSFNLVHVGADNFFTITKASSHYKRCGHGSDVVVMSKGLESVDINSDENHFTSVLDRQSI